MARNLSKEATDAENEELAKLLQQQPALQQQFDILKRWWESQAKTDEAIEPEKITRILQRSSMEKHNPKPGVVKRFVHTYWRAAIMVGVLACATVLVMRVTKTSGSSASVYEVLAQNGSRTRTILPDGSTVWLNAGSRLSYKPGLTGPAREVTLEGEAYFDVMKREGRAFIVHTKEIDITVLGTAFNVKSYPDDNIVEATLIHGLVSITSNSDKTAKPVYLRPRQKFVLPLSEKTTPPVANASPAGRQVKPAGGSTLHVINLESVPDEKSRLETAWVYNRLEFRGDSFEALAKKLERWYNVTVRFGDDQVKQLTFNGSLENETVEEAFKALQAATPFRYTINQNEISVSTY